MLSSVGGRHRKEARGSEGRARDYPEVHGAKALPACGASSHREEWLLKGQSRRDNPVLQVPLQKGRWSSERLGPLKGRRTLLLPPTVARWARALS